MAQLKLQVPDTLLDRGAAILSGGIDGLGVPLVTIKNGELEQCEIIALFLHYLHLLTSPSRPLPSVAPLIDLSNATKGDVSTFVESIQAVERPKRGRIAAVYCVKPKSNDRSRQLKKLLGLKPSKKISSPPLFKVILVKSVHELYNYIDPSSLTAEFGGSLHYNHQAWLYYHKTVLPTVQSSEEVLLKLPAVKDRIELLQEYDLADKSSQQLLTLRQEQLQQYHTILKEIRLEETIDRCKQVLHLLEKPETDTLLAQVHAGTLSTAECRLREMYQQLTDDQTELNVLWTTAEHRINVTQRVQKCREKATQIHRSILQKYKPELKEHPAIGKTLSQAELYRTHFTTSLYEPAKDLLTQATETLEQMCRLSEEAPELVCNISDVTRLLTDAINPFTEELQRMQDIYVSVHVFHLLFEKSVHWYKRVLKFLPDSLKQRVEPGSPNRLIHTPPEWRQAVISFLSKHPPPREEHILKLDSDIPHQVDRRLKHEAHALALRVRFLQRLLRSRRLPSKLITAAFTWKDEIMGPGSPLMKPRQERMKHQTKTSAKQASTHSVQQPVKPKRNKQNHAKSESNKTKGNDGDIRGHISGSENFILRERKPEPTKPSLGLSPSSVERFVRLTFTPNDPNTKTKHHFTFPEPDFQYQRDQESSPDSLGLLGSTQDLGTNLRLAKSSSQRSNPTEPGHQESVQRLPEDASPPLPDWAGSESGIDVVEQEDPYDSIVSKIREVSVSRLPSELKLKYVTDLLNVSLKRAAALRQSQTRVMDISEDEDRSQGVNPTRRVSMMRDKLTKSVGNLTDPAFYTSDAPQSKSLYSFDDTMTEQRQFEDRYKHLKCSFNPEDIGLVLSVMNENRTVEEHKLRSAYSMNDLDSPASEGFMISKYHDSMFDLQDFQQSPTSSLDHDEELALTGFESLSAEDGGSESTSLQLDVVRLKQCQEERVAEESQLAREQDRLDDIQLEAESLNQDEVEASLRRSEVILNQEEAALSLVTDPSDVDASRRVLKKRVSTDLGYDSTTSLPVTPSHGSNTSTLQRIRDPEVLSKHSGLDPDPFRGPDFY